MSRGAPLFFDIHRFALDDGPGIRTTVFFKGCPLSCQWCHNPEAFSSRCEIAFSPERCIHCHACLQVCPEAARPDDLMDIDRSRCKVCGRCADVCPTLSLRRVGKHYSLGALMEILMQDHHLYASSGGGVTVSGGEPTLHGSYLRDLLRALKAGGIHTAIQTNGHFSYEHFTSDLLPWLDLIYYDVKLFDRGLHERYTGVGNDLILENLRRLTDVAQERIVPRVPLVPGITATMENMLTIASWLGQLGYRQVELLSFNRAGLAKRTTLGYEAALFADASLTIEEERRLKDVFYRTLSAARASRLQAG